MADHQRSAFHGLNSVLKSLGRRISSSGNIAMYRFWRFGLKLPIHIPFVGVFGAYFPIWRHPSSRPPKGPSLGGNTSFEPFSVRISATVRPVRVMKKKYRTTKVTEGLYFPYLGGSPNWTNSTQKLHGEWCPRRNHVCQVSNWYLHALRFYSGSNFIYLYSRSWQDTFSIFLLIFAWVLQQCSVNALPVINWLSDWLRKTYGLTLGIFKMSVKQIKYNSKPGAV